MQSRPDQNVKPFEEENSAEESYKALVESMMTLIENIRLNEKECFNTIDKEKLYNNYISFIKEYEELKNNETIINKTNLLLNSLFRIIFSQTNLKNINSIYSGLIDIIKYDENINKNEEIKNHLLDFINRYYEVYSKYHEILSENKDLKGNDDVETWRTFVSKITKIHEDVKYINDTEKYNFIEVKNDLYFLYVNSHLYLAFLTEEKADIEKARKLLLAYNTNSTYLIIHFDHFCQYRPLGIKICETLPNLAKIKTYLNTNFNRDDLYNPNEQDKIIYHYFNKLTFILEILSKEKFNETTYDDTKSLSENILIHFKNIETNLMESHYADDMQKRLDFFLFTESIIDLLEEQSLTIFKDLYIDLVNKHLNYIKDFLFFYNNENINFNYIFTLFYVYLDRCKSLPNGSQIKTNLLETSFEILMIPVVYNSNIFLKNSCNLYKESSLSNHVVKCHIIYIATMLNLDIKNEFLEFEKYLPKDSNVNVYLLDRFIKTLYDQYQKDKQSANLINAYRAVKEALPFFGSYEDDENFKKRLKIYRSILQREEKILQYCIEAYQIVFADNSNYSNKKTIKNYIKSYLWIIDEIPVVKTERYKKLLEIKYSLYSILSKLTYDTENTELYRRQTEFDAINDNQLFMKGTSVLAYIEKKILDEDKLPDLDVLRDRQSMCTTSIEILRKLINSSGFTEKVPHLLVFNVTNYINFEFYLNNHNSFEGESFYEKQRSGLIDIRSNSERSLDASFNYCCNSIFMRSNLNNIAVIYDETEKIISKLLIGITKEEKNIKAKLLIWMKKYKSLYSKFHEMKENYENSQKIHSEKEHKKIAKEINDFLNDFIKIDSEMILYTITMKNLASFMEAKNNLNLACLTMEKEDIEKAKKSLSHFNKTKDNFVFNYDIFCKCNLLGIKLYEIIPFLHGIKRSPMQNSTDPAVIYKYLNGYLFAMINTLTRQDFKKILSDYNENKSLAENFLENLNIINENFKDKKFVIFLINEAMLELLNDTGLKEKYNDLYNNLIRNHLDNIKSLLDVVEINNEDKFYLSSFYIGRYNSIPHNENESKDDYTRIYSNFCDLINTSHPARANELVDGVINRFPNEIEFFRIKLSLLENTFNETVSHVDNEVATVSMLPEKLKPNNKNESNSKEYKAYSNAYTTLDSKLTIFSKCHKKYIDEKEKLDKLNQEIKDLYTSINQIDTQQATSDVLINLKDDFKKFKEINNVIADQKKVVQSTIKSLHDAKIKFDDALRECMTKEKVFKNFKANKDAARKGDEETKKKPEENVTPEAKSTVEAKNAEAERKKQEEAIVKKAAAAAAERKRQEEAAAKKAAAAAEKKAAAAAERKKQEEVAERKAANQAAARKREEEAAARKAVAAATARKRQEEAAARKAAEEAAKIAAAEEAAAKITAAEEAARIAAEEAARIAAEEAARIAAEEAAKIVAAEEAARIAAEEAAKIVAEEEAARIAAAEEASRIAVAEEAAKIAAAEEEAARIAAAEEAARIAAAEEAARIAAAEEAARIAAEEAARIAAEEAARIAAEKERKEAETKKAGEEAKGKEKDREKEESEKDADKVKNILLNGINDVDLANIYKLHKDLANEGIKLIIKGSFAARLAIFLYNPNNREIAKYFSIHDIDLVISYHPNNNSKNIEKIRSLNAYVIVAKETKDFVNVKRAKPNNDVGIDLDLTVQKSSTTGKEKFIPFHFIHLEIIEKDEIKDDDKIIQIGDYYFKLCTEEGKEKLVEKACKFAEFLVCKPEDQFNYYSYNIFKYLMKLSNCTPNNMCTSNASVFDSNLLPVDNIHNPLIDYYIKKLQSVDAKICYEEMKKFAIGIPEGKEDLARPFIQDFYLALLLNIVKFQKENAQISGYLLPTFKKLHEYASECANHFINYPDLVKNARDPQCDFVKWKKTIDEIAIKKLNEYKETQEHNDQLAQTQQPQQHLTPQFERPVSYQQNQSSNSAAILFKKSQPQQRQPVQPTSSGRGRRTGNNSQGNKTYVPKPQGQHMQWGLSQSAASGVGQTGNNLSQDSSQNYKQRKG